ncbi:MAG: cell division protein FtsZ [Candidatus Lloydbacteria bacterium RIFCSPHIGHO2_01_FULL_49_22]|uniref:Cell division protein FtsZ n=1 Tax=Candidatus Lloydbacteria bacterium RIFCSPHIGHO2_01_FULL_49_22 TaxID=1798658 RepID=A0A1G2CXM5_9BACT|nr:MAG: cell division protein FtsZ [Candidatus Lloydbacteria bacterium RIFCSPHIGHO2_01_FULL_49_22]OGZ10419.1 MAG: cell division protein FtsZ [Candidatus Lloydbacteria bacterium RIFCSPHIGHO2_02_FULL_50_18]
MPKVNPEIEAFARIKVVGIGGSGRNAVNHMVRSKVNGVEFIVANTDAQDLHNSLASKKIHIGKNLTRGLGTGMNPELGKRAAEETKEEIQEALKGADMVFIASGMGGGTGTGASPVFARTARELNALTIGVVTKPFFFEGTQRMFLADKGLEALEAEVDALIVIPNDKLLNNSKDTTVLNAFAQCDEVLRQAVEGISDLITTPGLINVDFADIKAVMADAGTALMGIGLASGENRAVEAARIAINSPLLDVSINGARGVLFAIAGGEDMTMSEIQEAAKVITESVDANARVIFGAIIDSKLRKGELKITVIASGFPETGRASKNQQKTIENKTEESEDDEANEDTLFAPKEEKFADMVRKDKSGAERAIFNTIPEEKQRVVSVKREEAQPKFEAEDEEDDDLGVIPSFLRRSKLR